MRGFDANDEIACQPAISPGIKADNPVCGARWLLPPSDGVGAPSPGALGFDTALNPVRQQRIVPTLEVCFLAPHGKGIDDPVKVGFEFLPRIRVRLGVDSDPPAFDENTHDSRFSYDSGSQYAHDIYGREGVR